MSHVKPRRFYGSATDPTAVGASITLVLHQAGPGDTIFVGPGLFRANAGAHGMTIPQLNVARSGRR